jgi:hypothetical protein
LVDNKNSFKNERKSVLLMLTFGRVLFDFEFVRTPVRVVCHVIDANWNGPGRWASFILFGTAALGLDGDTTEIHGWLGTVCWFRGKHRATHPPRILGGRRWLPLRSALRHIRGASLLLLGINLIPYFIVVVLLLF